MLRRLGTDGPTYFHRQLSTLIFCGASFRIVAHLRRRGRENLKSLRNRVTRFADNTAWLGPPFSPDP